MFCSEDQPSTRRKQTAHNIGLRRELGIPSNGLGKLLAINPKCYHGKKWE